MERKIWLRQENKKWSSLTISHRCDNQSWTHHIQTWRNHIDIGSKNSDPNNHGNWTLFLNLYDLNHRENTLFDLFKIPSGSKWFNCTKKSLNDCRWQQSMVSSCLCWWWYLLHCRSSGVMKYLSNAKFLANSLEAACTTRHYRYYNDISLSDPKQGNPSTMGRGSAGNPSFSVEKPASYRYSRYSRMAWMLYI